MTWKSKLTQAERCALWAFERKQGRSEDRWKHGTPKHPGGCVTSGVGDEPEERAMRKPWGKKPRRKQAKRRGRRVKTIRFALAQAAR